MAKEHEKVMAKKEGALHGVKIIDLSDERAIYGVKLLADLGADVVRPEPIEGDPLRARGPLRDGEQSAGSSLWHAFFASNRRFFAVDLDQPEGRAQLDRLITQADIVITSDGAFGCDVLDIEDIRLRKPSLVSVECTSFGVSGPWRDYLAPDLVAGALGGSVATTGDVDTPPLKCFGELNFVVSGAYVGIAALAALRHARETGEGQHVHVPVHHCIASCLEHVFMWHWYNEMLGNATDKALERRGSLHWSNAYVVMQAQGGSIMVTPTPDVDAQLVWLIEEGVAADLLDPKYQEIENRPEFMRRMMEVLREWVGSKDVQALFFDAQEHHAPYGWVLPLDRVAENPQLDARHWWQEYNSGGGDFKGPGNPYQFSETPWSMGPHGGIGEHTDSVLSEIGWGDER